MLNRKLAVASLALALSLFGSGAFATTCPTTGITNGHTADATDVTNVFTCIDTNFALLASPNFSGIVGIGADHFPMQETSFGYYSGFKVLRLGLNTSNRSLALNVDANAVAGGNFSGTGQILIGNNSILAPNGAGSDWTGVLRATAGKVYLGGSTASGELNGSALVVDNATNNVGIGTTTPGYTLTVSGTVWATAGAGGLSDRRHKTDIRPVSDGAIGVVMQLKPVSFLWKEPKDDGMKGRQIGFIAQDVIPVLPDVVLTMNDADKTLGLKYDGFIPILAKAIQEQQMQIEALAAANRAQALALRRLQAQVSALARRSGMRTAAK